MNFWFSVLGLISPLMLEYQQLFYISVAPSQSLHGTPWTRHLWDKCNKVEIILPIPSSTTHTDNKSNKVEGRKKVYLCLQLRKMWDLRIQDIFPLNYWQDEVVPSSSRHWHFYSHKTQLFPQVQLHSYSFCVLDPSAGRQNTHLELGKERPGNWNRFLF